MSKNNKKYKGDFGYIPYMQKISLLRAIGLFAICIALYLLGFFSTGTNANLLTFIAVLGCLPASKCIVNAVMFRKAKGCSQRIYDLFTKVELPIEFWDMYFTSYKRNYPVNAMILKRGSFIGFSEEENFPVEECENHLKEILKQCGGESIQVKMFTDENKFIGRALELKELSDDGKNNEFIIDNILNVSL